ncbi:MAG: peptidyl-prolyl cis-trans isomerase [Gemmataceae bacterium]
MRRRHRTRLLASAVLAGLALGGCQASGPARVADDGFVPDFTTLLKLPGSESAPAVTRAQKPAPPGPSVLELGPDAPGSKEARSARIRATVNGEAILDEEVVAAGLTQLSQARSEAEKAEILNAKLTEIIERELLMQDATARLSKKGGAKFLKELEKIAEREFEKNWLYKLMQVNKQSDLQVFTRMLREQGIPVDLIRRQWVRNFIAMEYVRTRVEPQLNKVGHEQVAEYYEQHPDEFKVDDGVVWQDIFIANARHPSPEAARQFAESLIARARKGEDFARLAKEFDNGESSLRQNAEGIGRKRGEVQPPQAEEVVFRLKQGEVGPPVEIETGYHLVRVAQRTHAGRTPFDDKTQKRINDTLKNKVFQQEMRKLINDLKRQAIIEVANEVK